MSTEYGAELEQVTDAQVAAVTREWIQILDGARMAVVKAQRLQSQLVNLDYDFSESVLSRDAMRCLNDAWKQLDSVTTIANGLLKPIVDAEKDAEIEQLRARNEELERRLANHCAICGDGIENKTDFDLAPGSSKPCHSPASHGYCGYSPPSVRCGNPDHHDHIGDDAEPIEGEGSDLD